MPSGTWKNRNRSPLSEDHRKKLSLAKIGNKNHLGKSHTIETRKKLSVAFSGSKSHLWRGGVTQKHHFVRRTVEYKFWRDSVFRRDYWKCVRCGSKKDIEADHIKPFAHFPELRFAIDNGRTLCRKCHETTSDFPKNFKKYE